MSKVINISYTILENIEVPDDATPDDIEEMIEINMADKKFLDAMKQKFSECY